MALTAHVTSPVTLSRARWVLGQVLVVALGVVVYFRVRGITDASVGVAHAHGAEHAAGGGGLQAVGDVAGTGLDVGVVHDTSLVSGRISGCPPMVLSSTRGVNEGDGPRPSHPPHN